MNDKDEKNEEKKFRKDLEDGQYESVDNVKDEMKIAESAAATYIAENFNLKLQVPEKDLNEIKNC